MTSNRWTKEQVKLGLNLYCQLPFGKLHSRNPEIIELARLIGRTPDAVAMKLCNIASLDPAITSTGRSGLKGASALDREGLGIEVALGYRTPHEVFFNTKTQLTRVALGS